ncbi:MAG TPA: S9 family peptidase [Flavitalea sp.]|nr:S9 family peptidase [Flavitalea sp.]
MNIKKENKEEANRRVEKKIPFSFNDLHLIKNISLPALSPDGSKIVAVITETDIAANAYIDRLALISVETGKMDILTEGGSPTWSPDGKKIAYERGEIDHSAIYILDVETLDKRFLAPVYSSEYFMGHLTEKNFAWSPDGKYIAYCGALPVGQDNKPPGNVQVIKRLAYKTKGGRGREVFADEYLTHIWCVPATGGDPFLITSGNYNEHSLSWSPDGRHIAFISNRTKDPDGIHNTELWSVNVQTKEIKQLTRAAGTRSCPRWSPDGRYIAYLGTNSAVTTTDSVADDTHAYVVNPDGNDLRCISGSLDRRVENIQWAPDGSRLFFTAGDAGSTQLYSVSAEGDIQTEIAGKFTVREYAISHTGKEIALVRTGITEPPELYLYSLTQGAQPLQLTGINAFVGEERIVADAETFWFTSVDQVNVQGWLMKPVGYEEGAKFPLALVIHGGPHNMFGYDFEERMQLLASHGFGVVFINPRGSHGYGQTFSRGCVLNWGGTDYKDLMAGVDHVIAQHSWIDADRLVVTGQSYGGFMSNWIITQTDRFKAAVVDGGLSNLVSFAGTSLYYSLIEAEFNGKPWENYPLLWQWSPLRNAKNVVTPTLFLHGDKDNEVPVSQAEEMFYALKSKGVETVFVRYFGEGHGWRPNLLPENRQDVLERTIDWFKTHTITSPEY